MDTAKTEAEKAGAGDRSLDAMSSEDLVEKMATSPIYAALGREGKLYFTWFKKGINKILIRLFEW